MIAVPLADEPPRIVAPAPYQVSFGRLELVVPSGTTRIVVTVDGKVALQRPVRSRRVRASLDLPRHEVRLRVVAVDADGARTSATVANVFGLPAPAAPRRAAARLDATLAATLGRLAREFGATAAFYVEDLVTGAGAAWNARARFPAASTLKLAIALEVLRSLPAPPAPGSRVDLQLRALIEGSSNRAANELEALIAGSTSGGSARVNALMRALGLTDSEMYGGYELEEGQRTLARLFAPAAPIPARVEDQPSFGLGKYTTAFDLGRLARFVHLAAGGQGPLVAGRVGAVSPAEARYLLYLMLHSADHGKLDRFVGAGASVAHKAGWIASARHDSGIVYWSGGAFVAAVMTWRAGGAGSTSDELAGRVAQAALRRLRALAPS